MFCHSDNVDKELKYDQYIFISSRAMHPIQKNSSFWENIFLARDLEVLKVIYLFRLTFQTNTVRHQNITKLKYQDVKLDQLSRCQNEKVRVKTANKDYTTNKCWGEKGGKDNIGLQIPGS